MSRKSKREIERDLETLEGEETKEQTGILSVYEGEDGEPVDSDGNPISDGEIDRAGLIIDYTQPPD